MERSERKRKLPPRAAARVEQNAKKRAATPSEPSPTPSSTPAPASTSTAASTAAAAAGAGQKTPSAPESVPPEEPQLPTSIQPGNPLPTVENPQPDDLPGKDYQSLQESGVLAESLSRSRHKWVTDGIFQKYWSRPTKRKGVIKEEPNNPPKDTMTKIGHVTVTVEPHVLEATMYAVKEQKPIPTTNAAFRPVLQYGPPNGVMPPPPKPKTPSTPGAQPASKLNPAAATATTTTTAVPTTTAGGPSPSPLQTPSQPPQQSPQSQSKLQLPSQPQSQPQPQPQPQPQLQSPAQIQPPSTQSQAQAHVPVTTHHSQIQPPAPAPPGAPSQPRMPQIGLYRSPSASATPNQSLTSPRGLESVLAPPQPQPPSAPIPPVSHPHVHPHAHSHVQPPPPAPGPTNIPSHPVQAPSRTLQGPSPPIGVGGPTIPPGTKPSTPAAKPVPASAPGADPIIVILAERASEDPHLRDLMKRVAVGGAAAPELAHFQRIIDEITAEYKRKGGQQGPSAERLLVDGKRNVKYFADEVKLILEIVLSSNPNQKSTDLKVPADSDPLLILLLKRALDDRQTKDLIERVARNKTFFHDATELQTILEEMKDQIAKEKPKPQPSTSGPSQATPANPTDQAAQGTLTNGTASRKNSLASVQQSNAPSPQQALRSKGPPPSIQPDFSAIALEFVGGGGDRYLFPKYSILEWSSPSQVLASFLIVRKGSQLEYGGDPALDYYQPITMRLHSNTGKHLEYLSKVVAPEDEVRRYMDDVMDNMTRAEYVLLAMRLPRDEEEDHREEDGRSETPKAETQHQPSQPGVLWNTKPPSAAAGAAPRKPLPKAPSEDEQYHNFIATIS